MKKYAKPLTYLITFGIFGFLHVFLRMKCVEKDYLSNSLRKDVDQVSLVNKELKARRAKLLSVKNLRLYAKEFGYTAPSRKQVVVIED